jgi:hypothetical protein
MKTKIHKVTLFVADWDDLGADSVVEVIEHTKYPNHCIGPRVVNIKTEAVDWSDDHPLNKQDSWKEAFQKLFPTIVVVKTPVDDRKRLVTNTDTWTVEERDHWEAYGELRRPAPNDDE